MTTPDGPSLDAEGAAAPPRRNGELVFQAPWEGRAFGIALALTDQGHMAWEAFRGQLIAAVAIADGIADARRRPGYYENWLAALRRLLIERGIVSGAEVEQRAQEFATGERDIVHPGAARLTRPGSRGRNQR